MALPIADPTVSRPTRFGTMILQAMLALAFTAAALAKLAGVPMMVDTFTHVGLGQWLRYVTAGIELAGAAALLTPGFAAVGGLLLAATMVCATTAHILRLATSPAPALILLALCLLVVWLRREQLTSLFGTKD